MSSWVEIENARTFYIVHSYNDEIIKYETNTYNDEWIYPPEEFHWKSKPYAKRYKGKWQMSNGKMAFDTIEEAFDQLDGRYATFLQSLIEDVAHAEKNLEKRKQEVELYKLKIKNYEKAKNIRTTSNTSANQIQEVKR